MDCLNNGNTFHNIAKYSVLYVTEVQRKQKNCACYVFSVKYHLVKRTY